MGTKENRSNIIINLAGNIASRGVQFARDLNNFAVSGQRSMAMLGRASKMAGDGLDGLRNRYTAVAAGFVSTEIVRSVGAIDARLTQLGVNAGITDEQLAGVKDRIFDIARAPNIRLDPSQMLSAVEQITNRTGKLDVAMDNLENVGLLMRATGADATSAGDMIADFYTKFDIKKSSDMKEVLSTLAAQGKSGAFKLKDLATVSTEVSDAFAMTGQKGKDAALQMGAMLQMIRNSTSSSDEAATSFSRLLATLSSERLEDLRKRGVEIFDPVKLKAGVREMRPVPEIIKDIIKMSGGDTEKLSQVFDLRSIRAIMAFAQDMKAHGDLKDFDKFLGIHDMGSDLTKDAIKNAEDFDSAMDALGGTLSRLINSNFSGPLKSIAHAINSMDPKTLDLLFKIGGGSVGLLAAAVAGRGLYKAGGEAFKDLKWIATGKRGGAAAAAGALGGGVVPVPVYMVNAPTLASQIAGGTGVQLTKMGKLGALAGTAVRWGVAGLAAYEAGHAFGTMIDKKLQKSATGLEIRDDIGSTIAHVLALFGNDEAMAAVHQRAQGQDFNGKLKITIDSQGKAHATRVDSDSKIDTEVYTGRHMGLGAHQ